MINIKNKNQTCKDEKMVKNKINSVAKITVPFLISKIGKDISIAKELKIVA